MIPALFQNAHFLLIAAALVSVPIIIHLINRMRFKRIRWAAMEFLLKAQKRTRRRLIIEQLILLALRCLLIALVGLLVARFTGCGDNNLGGKPNLHLVLLDDTLSMQDHWKGPDGAKNAFEVAKTDFLVKKIAKGLAQSKTNDQVVIVQLSKLGDPDYKPKSYSNLNDNNKMKEMVSEINEMQPSMLNVSMLQGIKRAKQIIGEGDNTKSRATMHILSDYRDIDWGGKSGEGVTKEILEIVKVNKDIKIRPIDTVHPPRAANQGGFPPSRDNVGIVDFRPDTRIVGDKMPVRFTITMANYSGKLVEVKLVARNEETGQDMAEVNFDLANKATIQKDRTRIELSPGGETKVTFDYGDVRNGRFFPGGLKEGESRFAHLSVRMTDAQLNALPNDGLLADNIRHTVIEVRDKVPILVIDGQKSESRKVEGKDSFILERALNSVPGASYEVVFGDLLPGTGGDPAKALEAFDLAKYPTIFIVNVPFLTPVQIANLENYVKEGGGVAFYMGPTITDSKGYNEKLYRNGEGVFPVPLKGAFPPVNEPELPTKKDNDVYELITREDVFKDQPVPIFSKVFEEPKQRFPLVNLPIHRYFKVDRGALKNTGRVFELATLPNDSPAKDFGEQVAGITQSGANYRAVLGNPEFAKFKLRLIELVKPLDDLAHPGSEAKGYHLAGAIEVLLTDKGSENPPVSDMNKLWVNSDDKVQSLKKQLSDLRQSVQYGDPFVVMQKFGKGKVVAVMSTVGRDWNEWAGGSLASVLFMPFVWELQNYLSSPGEEGNLTVGTTLPPFVIDSRQFPGERLKLVRYRMKTEHGAKALPGEKIEQFGESIEGKITFTLAKHLEPGLYYSELYKANAEKEIAKFAHTFNVDTEREGRLARVGSEQLKSQLIDQANEITKSKETAKLVGQGMADEVLVAKSDDLSESPWLFLILLLVLVAEQALAVHLSFHLKDNEGEMAPAGAKA